MRSASNFCMYRPAHERKLLRLMVYNHVKVEQPPFPIAGLTTFGSGKRRVFIESGLAKRIDGRKPQVGAIACSCFLPTYRVNKSQDKSAIALKVGLSAG